MSAKSHTTIKSETSPVKSTALSGAYVAEADYEDTIARNRVLPVVDVAAVPAPPEAYRPTDPEVRGRRLRRVAADHRAEALLALREAGGRDLRADLGKFAPDAKRAPGLADRIVQTGKLVTRVQNLLAYAKELDQIALSDALVFLEAENKQLEHALEHEPAIAEHYGALQSLFGARADAIAEGIARATEKATAEKALAERTVGK